VIVGQDLHFDVPGIFNVFFDVDAGIFEGGFSFCCRRFQACFQRDVIAGHTHPFTTTTGGRFDQHGITDLLGHLECFSFVGHQTFGSR